MAARIASRGGESLSPPSTSGRTEFSHATIEPQVILIIMERGPFHPETTLGLRKRISFIEVQWVLAGERKIS